ncbi:MAG TPA: BatD family protein [Gemmatimonadales bacterium]|nr:BatD family protein [Gemmatimonadales bacterium]
MRAALWLVAGLQAAPPAAPAVTARVSPTRLTAGEELRLTVRASTRSAEPLTMLLPTLSGFAIMGSRELTEVTLEGLGRPIRTTTRELALRAQRPGTLVIGAVRVRQAGREVATAPLTVLVDSAATGLAAALSPLARRLLDTAPPPARNDRVTLRVLVPGDSVVIGQQFDVVAAAWFPRELRARLRRAPILTLQTPEGVWSYPGAAPSDVAASRLVGGRSMDLFVAHEAVFPLTAGRIVIPPATLDYAVPITFSFFSREDRYALRSDSMAVTVAALPPGARPADDQRVVAHDLSLDLTLDPATGRVGEPIDVTVRLAGVGNVALWPAPTMAWPPALRAYPGEMGTRIESQGGRVAGTKTFHYLVVPDSTGAFLLPEVRYPYYDIGARGYRVATAAPRALAVAQGSEPRPARALPPLAPDAGVVWSDALAHGLAPWGWLALFVGPPFLAWRRRRRGLPADAAALAAPAAAPRTRLGRLEREFQGMLASHVPDAAARDGDGLARALRASGVESAVADHVMRLRDRLRAARYGPRGPGDAAELAAELEQVMRALGAEPAGKPRRLGISVGLVALAALLPPGAAQRPSAEALYDAGALRAAADSFAARAAAEPRVPAHWYNLGATLYRAGADGKASAAWTHAARLAPRDPLVRQARELLPAPDAASDPLLATGIATPEEWALAAGVVWIALWGAVLAGWRRSVVAGLALVAIAASALGGREAARRARPLAIVLGPHTAVRVAPYGGANAAATVEAGAALLVERRYGPWLEVRRADGVRGWLLDADVARL